MTSNKQNHATFKTYSIISLKCTYLFELVFRKTFIVQKGSNVGIQLNGLNLTLSLSEMQVRMHVHARMHFAIATVSPAKTGKNLKPFYW